MQQLQKAVAMLRLYDKDHRDITNYYPQCSNPSCLGEPWCSAWGICKATSPELHSSSPDSELACEGGSGVYQQQEAGDCADNMEEEIDQLMLELSQQEEQVQYNYRIQPITTNNTNNNNNNIK